MTELLSFDSDISELISADTLPSENDYIPPVFNNDQSVFDIFDDAPPTTNNRLNVMSDINVNEVLNNTPPTNNITQSEKSLEELVKDLSVLISNTRVAGYDTDIFTMNLVILIPINMFILFLLVIFLMFIFVYYRNTFLFASIISIIVFFLMLVISYAVARKLVLSRQHTRSEAYAQQIDQLLLDIIKLL